MSTEIAPKQEYIIQAGTGATLLDHILSTVNYVFLPGNLKRDTGDQWQEKWQSQSECFSLTDWMPADWDSLSQAAATTTTRLLQQELRRL